MFCYPTKYYEFHDETQRDEIYHDEIDGVNIYDIFLYFFPYPYYLLPLKKLVFLSLLIYSTLVLRTTPT